MATARATVSVKPTIPIRRYPPAPRDDRRRWRLALAVALVLLGVFGTGAGLGRSAGRPWQGLAASSAQAPGDRADALSAGEPVRLSVPAIGVTAPVTRVGLAADGTVAVPPLERAAETGWYDRGPTPGEVGPAIIVGHADTKSGPAVFYDLRKLRPGDRIEVTRADGSTAVFAVSSVERFDKDNLPVERVYGDRSGPGLRLITCGGQFLGGSVGYADNVIAFATLLSPQQS
ncbi:class F sortase [Micromonospora cathayae]|uniref:Class F sortase n=1 Tax=Micromonospora cathayae TaxID=3028804 RepID=A0ABY7ZXS9_9ACTN|nr:class F sortase [Micromonospora sp. HUAS 3]WDZ87889.1 class F sortase [Micromonospora sp. HUAS 3]